MNRITIPYLGGYVKDIKPDVYNWVSVFDISSSYPNQEISYNMSPETLLHPNYKEIPQELQDILKELDLYDRYDFPEDLTKKEIVEIAYKKLKKVENAIQNYFIDLSKLQKFTSILKKYNVCLTANGQFFKIDKEGFIPAIISQIYQQRLVYKNKTKELKEKLLHDKSLQAEYERNNIINQALKIVINSSYGYLGNSSSRLFEVRIAEAITSMGQVAIRGCAKYLEEKIPIISIIYQDTDSLFITYSSDLLNSFLKDKPKNKDIREYLLYKIINFNKNIITPKIKEYYELLTKTLNARKNTLAMDFEVISDKTIFVAKKKYIMRLLYDDGSILLDKPKYKIRNIEIIKSTVPDFIKNILIKCLDLIFEGNEDKLIKFLKQSYNEFKKKEFDDICSISSVNHIDKYNYENAKSVPIYTAGAINWNDIRNYGFYKNGRLIKMKHYPLIYEQDKVKYCYVNENCLLNLKLGNNKKLKFNHVFAIPLSIKFPEELKDVVRIDKNMQFEKMIRQKVLNIVQETMNWNLELNKVNLGGLF